MANGIVITGLDRINSKLTKFRFEKGIQDSLNDFGLRVVKQAKELAPKDEGYLARAINYKKGKLSVEINVNVSYAAYIEFGTRKFAAAYVSSLPPEWREMAAGYKGKGTGDYYDFLNAILNWVKRKKLAQITNSYTGRKSTKKADLLLVAEAIAFSILRNGIKPQPYLYPSVEKQTPLLIKDLTNLLND
jgi:hypothetical protein